MTPDRTHLIEKSGVLQVYYANKKLKHWKKRWLRLQDQHLYIYRDDRYKRLEKSINIDGFRVSITNPSDSVSQKGFSFKIYDPNAAPTKPIYFATDNQQSMTRWINTLRLSASIADDIPIESHLATDLHPIDTDSEFDYNAPIDLNHSGRSTSKSYKPSMPVAATSTLTEQNRLIGSNDEEEDSSPDDHRWYRPRSSSPPRVSFGMNNNIIHQSSSATMGSWGFDVNRSTNGQISSSFTSNNNINSDHRTITRTPRRLDESNENYNERPSDRSTTTITSPPPPPQPTQRLKLRTPTLTRRREGNDYPAVERLVLGPSRVVQSDYYPTDESPRPSHNMPPTPRSRQSSTRSILRRRSKSIGDFISPTTSTSPPPSSSTMTQSYHQYQYRERPELSTHNTYVQSQNYQQHPAPPTHPPNHQLNQYPQQQQRTYAEQELLAWQNRMLERDRNNPPLINRPASTNPPWTYSPRTSARRSELNAAQSSSSSTSRPMPTSTRPISSMSNHSGSQRFDHDLNEPKAKSIRIIKRYIELLYHLQTFYDRISDQLFGGNLSSRNNLLSQQSVFSSHCRRIAEQLQRTRPLWERKMIDLQRLLNDLASHPWSHWKTETTFLQQRPALLNSMQTINKSKDLDETYFIILNDIERVLNEDKLATQLQDELSTLLQHQSLLNDFTSLLQWNRQIYSTNEQNRVENVLPLLREQITTTDGYVSNVSQQLTELVTNLRSLEKYILSHLNSMPTFDEISSSRSSWRAYNENDIDAMKSRYSSSDRSSRQPTRPLSMHTTTTTSYQTTDSPNYRNSNNYVNEPYEWRRRTPSPNKTRSVSTSRHQDISENSERENLRSSMKWSPKRTNTHLNTNNSNNNPSTSRIATVKPARRENGNLNSILKPYPSVRTTIETRKDFDVDTIDKEIFKPDKVEIPDRLIEFDNDDQTLTPKERLAKIRKKEEVRKMLSKQSMQDLNELELNEGNSSAAPLARRFDKDREKALNLQAALAEEAKEKSRQVAAKHYLNKSYQQRTPRLQT